MLDDKNITPSFVKQASCILQSDLLVLDLDFRFFYLNQCLAMANANGNANGNGFFLLFNLVNYPRH